jgi:hypothetical protein
MHAFSSECKNPLFPGSEDSGTFGNPRAFPLYPTLNTDVLSTLTMIAPTRKRGSYERSEIFSASAIHTSGHEGRSMFVQSTIVSSPES